jgi:hypothetical protein
MQHKSNGSNQAADETAAGQVVTTQAIRILKTKAVSAINNQMLCVK